MPIGVEKQAKISLESLGIYRGLLEDPVIKAFYTLIDLLDGNGADLSSIINKYNDFYYTLIEFNGGNSFKDYIISQIIFTDNFYGKEASTKDFNDLDESIKKAVENDLICLGMVGSTKAMDIKEIIMEKYGGLEFQLKVIKMLPEWDFREKICCVGLDKISSEFHKSQSWDKYIEILADFHRENGAGIFAQYRGFLWTRQGNSVKLQGIEEVDPTRLSDLIGYELERNKVTESTLQFLNGYPGNNILLYGDRGTGKSSTVKALLNEYYRNGLRIIEVPRQLLFDLPQIIQMIKDRPQKFIIFIDDLAFDDNEESYTALKAILEGGLACRPKNVVIYATSNRKHLIKEKFSDRVGLMSTDRDDQVRAGDTMQEQMSLGDRFGITVTFLSSNRKKYLEIVEGLAIQRGLKIEKEELHMEALKWEARYNGPSPRTARQFLDWLEGHKSMGPLY